MPCFCESGLKFECQGCRHCCSGEEGYVFLSLSDLDRLCAGTGMERVAFLEKYCVSVDMGICTMVSLAETAQHDCVFLTSSGCSVYESRPTQCRTYPFWIGIADDKQAWEAESRNCPGIGKGRLFSKDEVEKIMEMCGDEIKLPSAE